MSADRDRHADDPDVGLLLVGHGSRVPAGVDEFLQTARLVARYRGDWAIEPSFLEFARPSIAEGFDRLARRGARRIVVAPVILFASGHIRRDIPQAVATAAAGHPGIFVAQAEHLGCHESLVELSQRRYDEAMAGINRESPSQAASDGETALVIVGRGSRDSQATAEMLRFTDLRRQQTALGAVKTSFLAMALPPLENVLDELVSAGHAPIQRIVVQPHLLFRGELLERIGKIVACRALERAQFQWVVAEHLGVDSRVIEAIVDRANEALAARVA